MKILCISDTHNQHSSLGELPEADVLVHCGDITRDGTEAEAMDFVEWFLDQQHEYKVFVGGNHDLCLYGSTGISGLPDKCYYLSESGVQIDGLRFYGLPLFIPDVLDGNYDRMIRAIPEDTDILITHQPPLCILSGDFGDLTLRNKVKSIQPRLHLFGHAHDHWGRTQIDETLYVNSALLTHTYEMKYEPMIVEI